MGKLSKSEYKYRYKYFYENHLNKYVQSKVDEMVATDPKIGTYKNLYKAYREGNPVLLVISCDLASHSSKAFSKLNKAYSKLNENTVNLNKAIKTLCQTIQQIY